jgi:uncharacterized repeat protein (TIGR01451 family)/fimbrial isopeptide formation D2 family protein
MLIKSNLISVFESRSGCYENLTFLIDKEKWQKGGEKMWNPMQKKMVLILFVFVFIMTISGAVSAASGSNITNNTTDCDKITKNVTNLNGCNDTINYNDTVNFTIKVRNDHSSTHTFRVNDTLPAGLEYVSYTATKGTYNATTGIWTIGNLNSHQSAILNIIAKVTGSDTCITNTAKLQIEDRYWDWNHWCWVYYWDYDARANTTFCVPPAADLEVCKTVNDTTPNYHDSVNWTVTAKNNGPNCASGVVVNDPIPAGLEFVSYTATQGTTYDPNTGIWTIGNLDAWCQAVLNIITRVNASCTEINNAACITGCEYDPCLANNEANASICIPCAADLEVCKTVNDTKPNYQDTINYSITAKNNGPNNATGVKINDLLPAGLEFVSYTATQGTYDAATGIWTIGNLDSLSQAVLNIIAKVNISNTCISNSANITGCEYDPCLANNNATTTICVPAKSNLYVDVTAPTPCLGLNDKAQITFKVGNRGPDSAKNTVLTFVIPEGMEYLGANVDYGTFSYDAATRTITWILGDVPVGDPYMWISVRVLKEGNYLIKPTLNTETYDPNLGLNIQFANICADASPEPVPPVVHGKTIPLQKTGLPIGFLVTAILMVFTGLIVPKRK